MVAGAYLSIPDTVIAVNCLYGVIRSGSFPLSVLLTSDPPDDRTSKKDAAVL